MKVLLIGLALFANQAFAGSLCDAYDRLVNHSANFLSSSLECTNTAAVLSDVDTAFGQFGLCQEEPTVSEETFCSKLATIVIEEIAVKVPEAWECSLTTLSDNVRTDLEKLCSHDLR